MLTMEASEAYVRRIRLVAAAEPIRLIGHVYTRYLGDLSGGQILARIAERSLGLAHGAGLDFYDFEEVADIPAMKTLFRARLDELDALPEYERAAVIDEAITAFRHNIAVFDQLKGNALLSFLRNLPLPWVRAARLAAPSPAAAGLATAVGTP
jgi:heme oxygenase